MQSNFAPVPYGWVSAAFEKGCDRIDLLHVAGVVLHAHACALQVEWKLQRERATIAHQSKVDVVSRYDQNPRQCLRELTNAVLPAWSCALTFEPILMRLTVQKT